MFMPGWLCLSHLLGRHGPTTCTAGSPPPCGEGLGVGVLACARVATHESAATPLPSPPPQGGRERESAPPSQDQDAAPCSVHVLLVAPGLLEIGHEGDRLIERAHAVLCDDLDQRALDVLGHALGIAAHVEVRALGEPRPHLAA